MKKISYIVWGENQQLHIPSLQLVSTQFDPSYGESPIYRLRREPTASYTIFTVSINTVWSVLWRKFHISFEEITNCFIYHPYTSHGLPPRPRPAQVYGDMSIPSSLIGQHCVALWSSTPFIKLFTHFRTGFNIRATYRSALFCIASEFSQLYWIYNN